MKQIYIFALLSIFTFSGCGGGSSTEQTADKSDNNTESTMPNSSENEYDRAITLSAAKIDNLTIKVHENGMKSTSDMLDSLNSELHSFVDMTDSVTQTMVSAMKYADALAQPFSFTEEYKNYFDIDMGYTALRSAFTLKEPSAKKFILLSSDSSLFLEGHTIKSYFFDTSSLSDAWIKSISLANKDKNLYFTIHEIDENGTVHSVCNSFLIKSVDLKEL